MYKLQSNRSLFGSSEELLELSRAMLSQNEQSLARDPVYLALNPEIYEATGSVA